MERLYTPFPKHAIQYCSFLLFFTFTDLDASAEATAVNGVTRRLVPERLHKLNMWVCYAQTAHKAGYNEVFDNNRLFTLSAVHTVRWIGRTL